MTTNRATTSLVGAARDKLQTLLTLFGGQSFNNGIYRIIALDNVSYWNDLVAAPFPVLSGRINCFAVDWMGRVFAIDSASLVDRSPSVVMLEPGTGEALAIPCNIASFHESELIQYREEALAESFFQQWIRSGGQSPGFSQCIGYKKPLLLGGHDTIDNLVVSDLDVYWTISSQLIQKIKGVAPGTLINRASIA